MAVPAHDDARFRIRHEVQSARSFKSFNRPMRKDRLARLSWTTALSVNSTNRKFPSTACPPPKPKRKSPPGSKQKARQKDHQLQTPRLALQPPALLGRAVPDRLETGRRRKSLSRSVAGNRVARAAADARRLQTHARRPAAARPREGLGESAGRLDARNQHHAAMGRLVAGIISATSTRRTRSAFVGKEAENYWMGAASSRIVQRSTRQLKSDARR